LRTALGMQKRWATRVLLAAAMLAVLFTKAVSAVAEKVRATIMREKQSRIAQCSRRGPSVHGHGSGARHRA
jgi:hypothetical protein